jgi:hypothetical protein
MNTANALTRILLLGLAFEHRRLLELCVARPSRRGKPGGEPGRSPRRLAGDILRA